MEKGFSRETFKNLPEQALTEVYRNKRIRLPFEASDVAFFLDRSKTGGHVTLRTLPFHHRSADLGVSTLMIEEDDRRKHAYLQIDVKGGGFVFPEEFEMRKEGFRKGELAESKEVFMHAQSQENPWGYDSLGLFDERMVATVVENADKLSAAGMRTEAIAAAYRTDTILIDGKETPVKELKKETVEKFSALAKAETDPGRKAEIKAMAADLKKDFEPVIVIRLMRSVFRLRDMKEALDRGDGAAVLKMIEEACQNLNYEAEALGWPDRFDGKTSEGRERWLRFIAGWFARNTGIMHRLGQVHIGLHMGNVTLAGEVVDLDSVGAAVEEKKFRGKPENRAKWLEAFRGRPFFRETDDGCVMTNDLVYHYKTADARFGLPKSVVKDIRDVCFSTHLMLRKIMPAVPGGRTLDAKAVAAEMARNYAEALGGETVFTKLGVGPEKLRAVFEEVAKEVVGRGVHYDPIPPDDAEDWG